MALPCGCTFLLKVEAKNNFVNFMGHIYLLSLGHFYHQLLAFSIPCLKELIIDFLTNDLQHSDITWSKLLLQQLRHHLVSRNFRINLYKKISQFHQRLKKSTSGSLHRKMSFWVAQFSLTKSRTHSLLPLTIFFQFFLIFNFLHLFLRFLTLSLIPQLSGELVEIKFRPL